MAGTTLTQLMTDNQLLLVRVDEKVTSMAEKVDRVHAVVIGNGEGGLVTRVALLEKQAIADGLTIATLRRQLTQAEGFRNKLIGLAVGAGLFSGVGGSWLIKLFT